MKSIDMFLYLLNSTVNEDGRCNSIYNVHFQVNESVPGKACNNAILRANSDDIFAGEVKSI